MRYAVLFPGQGSQYIKMCGNLISEYSFVKKIFLQINDILNFDLLRLILSGNMKELTKSHNAQPAVAAASYVLFQVLKENTDTVPSYMIGHSLGEISALIASEAVSLAEGITFVRERGKIMDCAIQDRNGEAGIVVDMEETVLAGLIQEAAKIDYVAISGYNSPKQFIVAGTRKGIAKLDELIDKKNIGQFIPFKMMPMKANAPYHSKLMEYLQPKLAGEISKISLNKPRYPIISTVTNKLIDESDDIRAILEHQLTTPVYWTQALNIVKQNKNSLFIDIGPGEIVKNLVRENKTMNEALAFDNSEDFTNVISKIA